MTKKRRQHYVWRHYLRAWSDNNDHLYCLRAGKVFKSNLVNVAQERDFYRLKELSAREIVFIEKVFLESFPEHLQEINRDWIEIFNQVFQMRKRLEERGLLDEEWEKFLDLTVNNFEEEAHAKVESDSIKFLDSIKSEDVSFFDNDDDYMDFLLFLCIQYFRTQKIKFDVLAGLGERFTDIDFEAVWSVLKYMFATNLSYELFTRKGTTQPILLKNEASKELITGDQPAVNTFSIDTPLNQPVDDFELYYPVSPKLGVLITNRPEFNKSRIISLSETDVAMYNNHIIQNSHQQLYASAQQALN